jgi:hypothetical protein
VADANAI